MLAARCTCAAKEPAPEASERTSADGVPAETSAPKGPAVGDVITSRRLVSLLGRPAMGHSPVFAAQAGENWSVFIVQPSM